MLVGHLLFSWLSVSQIFFTFFTVFLQLLLWRFFAAFSSDASPSSLHLDPFLLLSTSSCYHSLSSYFSPGSPLRFIQLLLIHHHHDHHKFLPFLSLIILSSSLCSSSTSASLLSSSLSSSFLFLFLFFQTHILVWRKICSVAHFTFFRIFIFVFFCVFSCSSSSASCLSSSSLYLHVPQILSGLLELQFLPFSFFGSFIFLSFTFNKLLLCLN